MMFKTTYRVYQESGDKTWEFVFQSPSLVEALAFKRKEVGRMRLYRFDRSLIQDEHTVQL